MVNAMLMSPTRIAYQYVFDHAASSGFVESHVGHLLGVLGNLDLLKVVFDPTQFSKDWMGFCIDSV